MTARGIRIRDLMSWVLLASLIAALVVQSTRVSNLEARVQRLQSQHVQLGNIIAKSQMPFNRKLESLTTPSAARNSEIAGSRPAALAAETQPLPVSGSNEKSPRPPRPLRPAPHTSTSVASSSSRRNSTTAEQESAAP